MDRYSPQDGPPGADATRARATPTSSKEQHPPYIEGRGWAALSTPPLRPRGAQATPTLPQLYLPDFPNGPGPFLPFPQEGPGAESPLLHS